MEPAFALLVIALLFILIAVKAGFIGMAVLTEALWPHARERMLKAYQTRQRRCFFIGILNAVGLTFIAILLIGTQVLALPGLLLLAFVWGMAVLGYGIVYSDIGQQLSSSRATDQYREIVVGGIVAELAFLVPVVGQILSAVYFFRGIGAVAVALLARGTGADDLGSNSPSVETAD